MAVWVSISMFTMSEYDCYYEYHDCVQFGGGSNGVGANCQYNDFYFAYQDTAGVKIADLYSNQTLIENVDKSQDATACTGMMTANGGVNALFARLADSKDTVGDVVIAQTALQPFVMSVSYSTGGAPVSQVPGATVTYAGHDPASTEVRTFFSVST